MRIRTPNYSLGMRKARDATYDSHRAGYGMLSQGGSPAFANGSIVLSLSLFRFVRLSFSVRLTERLPISESGLQGEKDPPLRRPRDRGYLFFTYPMLGLIYPGFVVAHVHTFPCMAFLNIIFEVLPAPFFCVCRIVD